MIWFKIIKSICLFCLNLLYKEIDKNKDNKLSKEELKEFSKKIKTILNKKWISTLKENTTKFQGGKIMKNNGLITILAILCLLVGGLASVQLFPKTEVTTEFVPYNVTEYVVVQDERIDYLYNEAIEEDLKEELSLNLTLSEIETKDFKKEVYNLLKDEISIEEYKHITKILVKDSEVELNKDNAEVELELKVYFYVDSDEEETEKAVFNAVFEVTDLEDEQEVEYDLRFIKIY